MSLVLHSMIVSDDKPSHEVKVVCSISPLPDTHMPFVLRRARERQ